MSNRRKPEPPHVAPTEAEVELGYVFTCAGCDRVWPRRLQDTRTKQCLPCARAWRRDDMMSRRRGLGGVPLVRHPPAHTMRSKVLKREVDLNGAEAKRLIVSDPAFRAEVTAYVDRIVAKNAVPRPPLHGVMPLLSTGKKRQRIERVDLDDEEPSGPSPAAERAAQKAVELAMNVVEGEIVDEKPNRRR